MSLPRVILIGGAPQSGKTTLAQALAARIGHACISLDDVIQGIRAVTTLASHPGFHVMHGWDYREYYIQRSVDQLVEDGNRQHQATWSVVQELVRVHASYRCAAVIEGWGILPELVHGLPSASTVGLWLIASEQVLEDRLRRSHGFLSEASDPEKMIRGFLSRSLRMNQAIKEQARALNLPTIDITRHITTEELVPVAVEVLAGMPH